MKGRRMIHSLAALLATLLHAGEPQKPLIAVSNYPLQWVCETLVGDQARVVNLTQDAENPREWIPDEKGARVLEVADLIVLQGGGYEIWAKTFTESNVVFRSSEEIFDIFAKERNLDEVDRTLFYARTEGRAWLDPLHLELQARAVKAKLENRYPELDLNKGWKRLSQEMNDLTEAFDSSPRLKTEAFLLLESVWLETWGRAYGWRMKAASFSDNMGDLSIPPVSDTSLNRVAGVYEFFPARLSISSRSLPESWESALQRRFRIWTFRLSTGERPPLGDKATYATLMLDNLQTLKSGFAR